MTETEWLSCTDPARKLCLFRGGLRNRYNRKIRLFACACCRLIWEHLVDERSRNAVKVAEQHADGKATDAELRIASTAASQAHREIFHVLGKTGACREWAAVYAADAIPFHGARNVIWMAATSRFLEIRAKRPNDWDEIRLVPCTIVKQGGPLALVLGKWKVKTLTESEGTGAEKPVQMMLLHDIFANPYRPSPPLPHVVLAWNDRTILRIAQGIYEERKMPEGTLDNSRLAILHDALLEAGCADEELLTHLRSESQHVRGCWAVDLILGKE